jgi:serine/threonine protein kinase
VSSLLNLDPPFRKNKNLLRHMTVGLTDCYSGIALQAQSISSTDYKRNEDMSLLHSDTSYTDIEPIGSGAFSVVTRAHDLSGHEYAIKKVDSKYLLLALRELIFLRFMQLKTFRGGNFCKYTHVYCLLFCVSFPHDNILHVLVVSIIDAYAADDSVCLVLELCQHTLMDFITDLRSNSGDQPDEEDDDQQLSSLTFSDEVLRPM